MAAEGKEVREAYDGPEVEHDQLISEIDRMIHSERERSSDASESAAETKEFLEETGLNSTVLNWGKTILKDMDKKNGQQKAMDKIRSAELIIPMLKNHVGGQGTAEMDLDGPEDQSEDPVDPPTDLEEGNFEFRKSSPEGTEPADPETEEFNAEVDETMGDGDVVTPIDFGGGQA